MKLYLKNKNGEHSVSLTMAVISFTVVTLWLTLWVILTAFDLTIPPFDATSAMAYLSPILMLYFARKNTDAKNGGNKNNNNDQ